MKIAVSGASGLIGTALCAALTRSGHDVVRLVRREARSPQEVSWDPSAGTIDISGLTGLDVAINLSGAGVADRRWTPEYKKVIADSRRQSAETFVAGLLRLPAPPTMYLQASGVGYYADCDDQVVTETTPAGRSFLSDVYVDWEAAAQPAADAGIGTTLLRTGLVMTPDGGAFGKMLPLYKAGLGGPLGNGQQWWPWITLADHLRAIEFIIAEQLTGPINLVGPQPARNHDVSKALAKALRRPAILPAPAIALRLALGEFAAEVLSSIRAEPRILLDAGFTFTAPTLDAACRWLADPAQER